MHSIEFPFFHGVPTVIVSFELPTHGQQQRRLLVDSGFTGKSAFVLSQDDAANFKKRSAAGSRIAGALAGPHQRVWVKCSLPALDFKAHLMAISADLRGLSLPPGVDGLAGLTFLLQFQYWGAKQLHDGWHFAISMDEVA